VGLKGRRGGVIGSIRGRREKKRRRIFEVGAAKEEVSPGEVRHINPGQIGGGA